MGALIVLTATEVINAFITGFFVLINSIIYGRTKPMEKTDVNDKRKPVLNK